MLVVGRRKVSTMGGHFLLPPVLLPTNPPCPHPYIPLLCIPMQNYRRPQYPCSAFRQHEAIVCPREFLQLDAAVNTSAARHAPRFIQPRELHCAAVPPQDGRPTQGLQALTGPSLCQSARPAWSNPPANNGSVLALGLPSLSEQVSIYWVGLGWAL